MPSNLSIGSGFVINSQTKQITREIDIIVYENEYPPIFIEGDFVILESISVKGIIEVKTKLDKSRLATVIGQMDEKVQIINVGMILLN